MEKYLFNGQEKDLENQGEKEPKWLYILGAVTAALFIALAVYLKTQYFFGILFLTNYFFIAILIIYLFLLIIAFMNLVKFSYALIHGQVISKKVFTYVCMGVLIALDIVMLLIV